MSPTGRRALLGPTGRGSTGSPARLARARRPAGVGGRAGLGRRSVSCGGLTLASGGAGPTRGGAVADGTWSQGRHCAAGPTGRAGRGAGGRPGGCLDGRGPHRAAGRGAGQEPGRDRRAGPHREVAAVRFLTGARGRRQITVRLKDVRGEGLCWPPWTSPRRGRADASNLMAGRGPITAKGVQGGGVVSYRTVQSIVADGSGLTDVRLSGKDGKLTIRGSAEALGQAVPVVADAKVSLTEQGQIKVDVTKVRADGVDLPSYADNALDAIGQQLSQRSSPRPPVRHEALRAEGHRERPPGLRQGLRRHPGRLTPGTSTRRLPVDRPPTVGPPPAARYGRSRARMADRSPRAGRGARPEHRRRPALAQSQRAAPPGGRPRGAEGQPEPSHSATCDSAPCHRGLCHSGAGQRGAGRRGTWCGSRHLTAMSGAGTARAARAADRVAAGDAAAVLVRLLRPVPGDPRICAEVTGLVEGVTHVEVDAEEHLDAVRALRVLRPRRCWSRRVRPDRPPRVGPAHEGAPDRRRRAAPRPGLTGTGTARAHPAGAGGQLVRGPERRVLHEPTRRCRRPAGPRPGRTCPAVRTPLPARERRDGHTS